jgi:DedD protein
MEDTDVQLQIKKRARRRLVGAVAFVSVVAVVLPMVMDHQPRQHIQEVEIRIPGQGEKPFAPKFAAVPVEKAHEISAEKPVVAALPDETKPSLPPTARIIEATREKTVEKHAAKPVEKPVENSGKNGKT